MSVRSTDQDVQLTVIVGVDRLCHNILRQLSVILRQMFKLAQQQRDYVRDTYRQ